MEEKDKFFIKNSKIKLKDMMSVTLNSTEDYENNLNELKTFYLYLIENKSISNNNKVIFFQLFLESAQEHLRQKFLTFLIDAVLKIYQKETNTKLLIENDYFVFKFLTNKEIFKILIYKYSDLVSFNLQIFEKHIHDLSEAKTIMQNKNIFLDTVNYCHLDNVMLFFLETKKQILEKQEDKYFDLINNQHLFKTNDKEEIIFNSVFIEFVKIFMGLKIINKPLKLETSEEDLIRQELEELVLLWPF